MVRPAGRPSVRHITYKCELTLMASQWDELAAEAHRRNITGHELIQAVLSQYVHGLKRPEEPPIPSEPPPEAE